jgi:2-(1,2-epoxy-1,2-dihydrophenyl)acetyl-CoA isomerase
MAYETLLTTLEDGVFTITLNRPGKLNAFTEQLLHELLAAFREAEANPAARVIVLTGAGRGFCAGQDLAAAVESGAGSADFSYSQHLVNSYNPLILMMRALPKPIIGAINGVAAGAGMSLALACDLRLTAESASFVQAFVKVGLIPDSGSTWLLPRLVGAARALELMLTGRRVGSAEALTLGLVNQVIPDADFTATVARYAAELANAPTATLGLIKQAAEFALTSTLEQSLFKEAELQDVAGRTADHMEGVIAFLQKRPATFQGR